MNWIANIWRRFAGKLAGCSEIMETIDINFC